MASNKPTPMNLSADEMVEMSLDQIIKVSQQSKKKVGSGPKGKGKGAVAGVVKGKKGPRKPVSFTP